MKQPATRRGPVVRDARPVYGRVKASAPRHTVSAVRTGRGKQRRPGRVLAVVALLVGIVWLVQHATGAGGAATAEMMRRVLGVPPAARLAPASRTVAVAGQVGYPARAAGHHPASGTPARTSAAAPANARRRAGISGRSVREAPSTRSTAGPAPAPRTFGTANGTRVRAARVVRRTARTGLRVTPPAPLVPPVIPRTMLLRNDYQVFETWNNCGPASLSMALSYFGIQQSQAALGQDLRPYQNAQGNNDDKDVTFDELAAEARTFGLLAYHRPNGTIQRLKRFIASGWPVLADTVLTKGDDIGHYRVVKGYDDTTGTLTQDDSMQGHNVQFSYADFNAMWKKYNYEYLVLVPKQEQARAEAILGPDLSTRRAWQETVAMDQAALAVNPHDIDSRLNLSVALYYVGRYQQSVDEFEKVQYSLPARTLWYQIEPIEAYYALGNYQKVFALSDAILNNGDRAFSELYILRGKIDQREGNIAAARVEFTRAVYYNTSMKAAQEALLSLTR